MYIIFFKKIVPEFIARALQRQTYGACLKRNEDYFVKKKKKLLNKSEMI